MAQTLADARSHNVPPDTFLRHYRDIRDCKDAHHDTGMALARAKKAAKADGVDLDALKMLEKLADLETDEAEIQLRHLREYAAWIDLPIGAQLDMFGKPPQPDAEAAEKQREHNAKLQGKSAGESGQLRGDNPYDAGSPEHVAWDRAWTSGNKVWLKGQKSLAGDLARNARSGRRKRGNGAHATAH
jgi:hypothetical protein